MSSSSTDDSSDVESWVEWFLIQEGHEFLCEIDRSFIEDNFNLYGLRNEIPHFRSCLNVILDIADHSMDPKTEASLDQHVMDLYGLIHARYILTKRGMDRMLRKYRIGEFGVCPLNECNGQPVLPIGLRDTLRYHEVMIYCPRCGLIFHPAQKQLNFRDDNLDGAYFGTTFAHLLLMQYPALKPKKKLRLQPYVPRVFGYKIRSQTEDKEKNKKDGRSSGSKEEAKHNPPSPSISQGPGPTITVLEENIQLKHEITALKKMLEDGGSSKVAYPVPAKQ